jgi:hypothetical protein
MTSSVKDDKSVTFFQENGYQVLRSVIPKNVYQSTWNFLNDKIEESLLNKAEELGIRDWKSFCSTLPKMNDDWYDDLQPESKHLIAGHFPLDVRLSAKLIEIACVTKLQNVLRSALCSEKLFMHMPPTARFVIPNNKWASVPPHQDISYNKHMEGFLTCWVPLVEINEKCGGVTIFPSTGKQKEIPVKKDGFWMSSINTENLKSVHYSMNPGDILLLNTQILHQSRSNISNTVRISIDYRFFGHNGKSSKHFLDLDTKDVHLIKD